MGFFVGGLILLFLIISVVVAFKCYEDDHSVGTALSVIIAIALVIAFFIVPFSFHTVEEGEVAVVKEFGEAKEVKGPGLNYDLWMISSYEYINTQTQELPIETMAYSSDAQVMTIQMTVQFRAMGDKAVDIVKDYGSLEALTSRITAIVTESPKAVVSKRTAMNVISDRASITPEVETAIISAIGEEYYVTIEKVTIANIDFSDTFEQAVEEKMVAEQAKLKAEYENDKRLAQAKAEAEAKILQAEADAKAKITAAEAESKANELLEKSITEKILRDKYLDKWNGQLPSTMVGEDTMLMIPAA